MRYDITLLFLLPCLSASQLTLAGSDDAQRPTSNLVDTLSGRLRRLFIGVPAIGMKGLRAQSKVPEAIARGRTKPTRNVISAQAPGGTEKQEEETFTVPTPVEQDPNPSKLEFSARKYFYGRTSINIGEGYKPMMETFSPTWSDGDCALAVVDVQMPMGMIIAESEQHPGALEIVEVVEGSNSEKAGVKVGDVLRATTAQKTDAMAAAEGNVAFNAFAGATTAGVEIKRALYVVDGRPIEGALEAIATNAEDKGGPGVAGMIFERRMDHTN